MPTALNFSFSFPFKMVVGAFNELIKIFAIPIALAIALILIFVPVLFLVGRAGSSKRGSGGGSHGGAIKQAAGGRHSGSSSATSHPYPGWYTVNKAHAKFGVPKSTIRAAAARGFLGFGSGIQHSNMHKFTWYFPEPHYKNWHNKHRATPTHEIEGRV